MPASTSFTSWRINSTTFAIRESDSYEQHPFIYAKVHPRVPIIILSDTGCNSPDKKHKHARYTHLREYLENYPVAVNDNKPLNPLGNRQYYIIFTHCHFDHTNGIEQFLKGGTTEIIASAAGRDFIESDLATHGHYKYYDLPVPNYKVTKWAYTLERLKWPLWSESDGGPRPFQTDLGISIIQTPGHTPDELAWYDHDEMHLSCGDSFYEEGDDGMPIIHTPEASLIEWVFSMQKLLVFVRSENARAAERAREQAAKAGEDGWEHVAKRVTINCAHQTAGVDGEGILEALEKFSYRVFNGDVPITSKPIMAGGQYYTWRDEGMKPYMMSLTTMPKLMDEARKFFNIKVE